LVKMPLHDVIGHVVALGNALAAFITMVVTVAACRRPRGIAVTSLWQRSCNGGIAVAAM
jgi:hypothetical protein